LPPVNVAESLLAQTGYVRLREVIAIVAGTRTKSGSTNFLRLHVIRETHQEGDRFTQTMPAWTPPPSRLPPRSSWFSVPQQNATPLREWRVCVWCF
jgi:pyruvate kinase